MQDRATKHNSAPWILFSTGETVLNMLEGFGQNIPYLPLRPGLAVTIWALIADES